MLFDKGLHFLGRASIVHAATGQKNRAFGGFQDFGRAGDFTFIRTGATGVERAFFKEFDRPVIGFGLNVLTEGQTDRATFGRVCHRAERAGQGRQKLFRACDAVEVTHDRLEAVIRADCAIAEIFDLLEDRVGATVCKHISGEKEKWQTVHMRQCRSSHHIRGARPDR